MRYTPEFLGLMKDGSVRDTSKYGISDTHIYALDIMFINDWLDKNFYAAMGDPIELDFKEKVDFAAALLIGYYNDKEYGVVENNIAHYAWLADWLEAHNNNLEDEPDSLLNILLGMGF